MDLKGKWGVANSAVYLTLVLKEYTPSHRGDLFTGHTPDFFISWGGYYDEDLPRKLI